MIELDPAGRAASARHPASGLVEQRGIALQTAPLLGLQQPEEADFLKLADRGVRQTAQVLGLLGPLPQLGQQFVDAV